MTPQEAAQARIDAMQDQVDDAVEAEQRAHAAVLAAQAAQAATNAVAGHVFTNIAGAMPGMPVAPVQPIQPTPAAPAAPAQPTPAAPAAPAQPSVLDPRGWTLVQWLCAIILAFVALKIGLETRNWVSDRLDAHGKAAWIIQVVWATAVTATGFFGGGWLGRAITDRYAARRAARQQNPPAAAGQNP